MSITINSILFTDDYTGLPSGHGADTGLPYLMGNVGDLTYVNIDFYVNWSALDVLIDFNTNKTITRKSCGFISGNFITDGFKVGDTIVIEGSSLNNGTFTITALTNSVITVAEALVNESATGVNIYGVTTVNYFDFYYNLVGNNEAETFNSLTDSKAVQRFSGMANPYYSGAFTLQPNSTSRAWWAYKVDGVDILPTLTDYGFTADHKQHFKLVFPFLITPLFKAEQLQILQNALNQSEGSATSLNTANFDSPSYFANQCLKFIYQIDAKYLVTNPDVDHSTAPNVSSQKGNTAWFNTFFPSGVNLAGHVLTSQQYDLVSITYTDNSANVLTALDIANETNVTIKIKRTGVATISGEKFVLNFMWLPTDTGKYQGYSQNNQANFREVFLHDRCRSYVGAASTNGDQYGTSIQALKSVTTTAIDADNFSVTFKVNFGSLTKSTLTNDLPNGNYMLWISPQSVDSSSLATSNRSAVIADIGQATLNTDDSSLLTVVGGNTLYYKYPDTQINGLTNYYSFVGDIAFFRNKFYVKPNCIIETVSVITEVQVLNAATNVILSTFPIQSWVNSTSAYYNGVATQINLAQVLGFDLPDGDIRNTRSINRTPQADPTGYYSYELIYGFQLGFQWWQNVSEYSPEFESAHTQYWANYSQDNLGHGKKSVIKHKIVWEVTDTTTGVTTEFIQYSDVKAVAGNTSGNSIVINTADVIGNSLSGVVPQNLPFSVEATMTGAMTIPADATNVIGKLTMYYQNGSTEYFDSITNLDTQPETPDSVWTSPVTLVFNTDTTWGYMFATANLSNATFPIKNILILATISYQTATGLVTSTSEIQIQTDSASDIYPDLTT